MRDISECIVDFHCHPAMKPFGQSFDKSGFSVENNPPRSLWDEDPPTFSDKLINYAGTLTRFSQANFRAMAKGGIGIIAASLYPPEKGFFTPSFGTGTLADTLGNFVTQIGKKRIDYIQKNQDYFLDLVQEYEFYLLQNRKEFDIKGERCCYSLVRSWDDIEENLSNTKRRVISVVVSIEGAHCFNTGHEKDPNPSEVLMNVQKVKNWEYKPFFITLAHHFYNHLCGHGESISPLLTKWIDQSRGLDTGFTDLGKQVVNQLLDPLDGKRILIDIKHMSAYARKEYYKMLEEMYPSEKIPLIVSHGAFNGLHSFEQPIPRFNEKAEMFQRTSLNFYDDEIIKIAESRGIFCLQLDERRVADPVLLKKISGKIARRKILYHRSKLVWNQIQHAAEILDQANLPAWTTIGLGTDFDGIIDPLNGYWTSEDLPCLEDYLLKHAYNYMNGETRLKNPENLSIDPEEIIDNIFRENAIRFLKTHFKASIKIDPLIA